MTITPPLLRSYPNRVMYLGRLIPLVIFFPLNLRWDLDTGCSHDFFDGDNRLRRETEVAGAVAAGDHQRRPAEHDDLPTMGVTAELQIDPRVDRLDEDVGMVRDQQDRLSDVSSSSCNPVSDQTL